MLETIDFTSAHLTKKEAKPLRDQLLDKLIVLQQEAHRREIGLVVLFEGWDGAGKGSRISDLVYHLDARATSVSVIEDIDKKEAALFSKLDQGVSSYYPLIQDFWNALGSRGTITFFDRGWYTKAVQQMLLALSEKEGTKKKKNDAKALQKKLQTFTQHYQRSLRDFEQQLYDDGYIIVKFFLHISPDEQKKRLDDLACNPATQWKVNKEKLSRGKNYQEFYSLYDGMLENTNFDFAPWSLINGEDKQQANLDIIATLYAALEYAVNEEKAKEQQVEKVPGDPFPLPRVMSSCGEVLHKEQPCSPSLDHVERNLILSEEAYRKELKVQQKRFFNLELEMYQKRIPFIMLFEGWDAAGKGGAIKRIAQALDARAYTIYPSPAPTLPEKLHPHLWRYWTRLPKAGHVGIYDRSWYGRVLVERVEGFAAPDEWMRAYDEINAFERDLREWGALLLKFWVDISPEEQLRRFHARENNPQKQWKITEEDWRNREKYPQYKEAVQDMFRFTSPAEAPWIILESEDKRYARVKALQVVNDTLATRLREN